MVLYDTYLLYRMSVYLVFSCVILKGPRQNINARFFPIPELVISVQACADCSIIESI